MTDTVRALVLAEWRKGWNTGWRFSRAKAGLWKALLPALAAGLVLWRLHGLPEGEAGLWAAVGAAALQAGLWNVLGALAVWQASQPLLWWVLGASTTAGIALGWVQFRRLLSNGG